jgi:hypothetical protein
MPDAEATDRPRSLPSQARAPEPVCAPTPDGRERVPTVEHTAPPFGGPTVEDRWQAHRRWIGGDKDDPACRGFD